MTFGVLAAAPTLTPAPTPTPSSTDPFGVPFGTRAASGPVHLVGCHDVVIENRTFRQLGAGEIAISLENCQRVTVRAVDFVDIAEGIYALNSSDITIEYARYSNIIGPAQPRTGAHVGNFVQFNNVTGGLIDHNKGIGGDTEDIVSVYSSSYINVTNNQFQGTNWTSTSGSGIALCDGGGSNNVAQRNTLLNPGQVGAFIAGGTNCKLLDNIIYGAQRPSSNIGLYAWNQSSSPCSGLEVARNRVFWQRADGVNKPAWNAGNCGTVAGWSTNQWNVLLDPLALGVKL